MENFKDSYRKELADDLKTIRKVDPEAAQTALEEEQKTREYNVARAETVLHRQDTQIIRGLELSKEVEELLLEGIAQKYIMQTGGKTGEQYRKELKDRNIFIAREELLDEISYSEKSELVSFIRLTARDLGLPEKTNLPLKQIYKRAEELGLDLCHAEDGLEFRLLDESKQDTIIGMDPIGGGEGVVFKSGTPYAAYDREARNKPWLLLETAKQMQSADSTFLFRLRKKTEIS